MPDITMCDSVECPCRERCYRNAASGTIPDSRQSFFVPPPAYYNEDEEPVCDYYWPRREPRFDPGETTTSWAEESDHLSGCE